MSKVCKFCLEKKRKTCITVCLNILCLICINIHYPWNYAEFDNKGYFNEFSFNTQWNNNDRLHTWLVQTKFNMGTLDIDNHHQLLGSWSIARFNMPWLSWAQQSISTRFSWSVFEILWRNICCNAPTMNNPQDLDMDSDCLAASFPVQWIRAHGNADKWQWRELCAGAQSYWKRKSSFDKRRMSGSNSCIIFNTF